MPISSPNPMIDHLLESSHRDDSYNWSNIGFGEEIKQVVSIEVNFKHLIWSSDIYKVIMGSLHPTVILCSRRPYTVNS